MSVRLGLIGLGRWGRRYVETIRGIPELRLAHICTRRPESVVGAPPDIPITDDWHALIRRREVDGMIIATPPELHGPMLRACLETGMPALVEKPLCLSLAEALELEREARRTGVPVLVGHTQLFQPAFEALLSRLPDPRVVRFIHSEAGAYGPFRKAPVPVLWDWGAHDVALCIALMRGLPESVVCLDAAGRGPSAQDVPMISMRLEFPGGAVAWVTVGKLLTARRRRFAVFAQEQAIVFDEYAQDPLVEFPTRWERSQGEPDELGKGRPIVVDAERPLAREVREFVAGISGRPSDRFGLGLAVNVIRVLDAAEVSMSRGAGVMVG